MSQNSDEHSKDEFTHIFNELLSACPRRYEVKSDLLSKHLCPLEYHTDRNIFGFCSNPQCRAQSRKVCDDCIFNRTHFYEPGFDYNQILFEDQVNRILELYKTQQIRDIQNTQFSILIQQLYSETNQSWKAQSELQAFYRKLEYLRNKIINMSTQQYIIQVDNRNLNLIQYLKENYNNLDAMKLEWKQQIQQLNGLENGFDSGLAFKQIQNELANNKKKNLLDILRQIFESRIYQENLVSQDDQKIIDRSIEILLRYAIEELGSNKIQDAIQICDIVIQNCKTNFQALTIKGMCLDKQSKYEEALQMFDQAILIKSDYYESYFRKGITLNHMKLYQKAIDQYKRALQLEQKSYQIYNKLANVYIKINQYLKANRVLERGILMNESKLISPQDSKLSYKEKSLQQAIKNIKVQINNNYNYFPQLQYFYLIEKQKYDQAIQLEPQYYLAYEIKAQYLLQMNSRKSNVGIQLKNGSQNKYDDINQNDREFINNNCSLDEKQLSEQQVEMQLNCYQQGISLFNIGRLQEAKAILEGLIHNKKIFNNTTLFKQLGVIYMKLDQPIESLSMINKAIDVDKNDSQSYKLKGKVLIMLGQYQIAQEIFEIAQKLGCNPNRLLKYQGIILQETNHLDQAMEILGQYQKYNPFNIKCSLQIGIVYLKQQKYDAAIELFNKVIELDSEYYLAYQQKGIALMKQYKNDESLANFEKSLELKPNDTNNWKLKGISLLKLSRFSESIKILQKALGFNPKDIQIQNYLDKSIKQQTKYEKLVDQYSKLIKRNPEDLNNYIDKGNTLMLLQQYDKAIKIFGQAKIIDTQQFQSSCSIEYCYYKISQDQDRIIRFQHIVQENITKLTDLKSYASFLISIKEYQFAVIIYEILCEIYPDDQELLLYDSQKYIKKNNRNGAQTTTQNEN